MTCDSYFMILVKVFTIPILAETGAQLAGGGGEVSPALFWKQNKNTSILQKKCLNFGKNTLFVCIYRLNSHLKCIFKSIFEFEFRTWNVFEVPLFPKTSPTPKNSWLHTWESTFFANHIGWAEHNIMVFHK